MHAGKRLVSYRLSLVVIIPLLVVLTGAAIAGVSYFRTRSSIRSLANELFAEVANQTVELARAHVHQAAPMVDLLAGLLADDVVTSSTDQLERRLLRVSRANPGFSWVSFSDAQGTFTGVQRLHDGTLLVNESHLDAGKTVMHESQVMPDGSLHERRHADDTGYDPRLRPFYTAAVAAKHRVWTQPYVFFDQGVPGITCAAPVYDPQGALRGVVTIDFDLNVLSEFVASLHTSEHTQVFVYTDAGVILAHPTIHVVSQGARGEAGKLVTKDDITDPLVREYFRAGAAGGFEDDDARYLAETRDFEPEVGLHWRVGAIAPEADFMGQLRKTIRMVLVVSLVVVLIALALAIYFARRLAHPLVRLAGEMDKVGRFELGGEPPPPSRYREIELMNHALANMRQGLASFAVYVPRDLVRAVLASGQAAELGGKTKPMTVLFSDLAGFTTLSEAMEPAALVQLLGGYFDEMTHVIAGNRGTIDKFIGDAIMAFWNAPMDEADHAAMACAAALACQRKLADMQRANPQLAGLKARIGLATGDVLVGNIGASDRMNYTVMGDTVNLASRLEGLGKVYGTSILVSEACRDAAGDRIVMRAIDVVAVKGKHTGVRVYEPLALVSDADATMREIAELSEQALDAYLARRWHDAIASYEALCAKRPDDLAARVLLDRCRGYETAPPSDRWSGAHIMTEK